MNNRNSDSKRFFLIVVPVYNAEKFLKRCITSITSQMYPNYHIFLVNDGSEDQSGSLLDELSHNWDCITVAHQENQGQIAARQKGIELALAWVEEKHSEKPTFLFVDADDSLVSGALYKIEAAMESTQSDILFYNMMRVDEAKGNFSSKHVITSSQTITEKKSLYKTVLFNPYFNSMCCKALSGELIALVDYSKYYHVRYGEDLLQSLEYYQRAQKVSFITDVLYEYHINSDSVMSSIDPVTYPTDGYVRSETWSILQQKNVWDESDFGEYMRWLQDQMRHKIVRIAQFPITYEQKAVLFQRIKQDPFNAMLIEKRNRWDIILSWLEKKQYKKICGILPVLNRVRLKFTSIH